jgi:hypothetical protein
MDLGTGAIEIDPLGVGSTEATSGQTIEARSPSRLGVGLGLAVLVVVVGVIVGGLGGGNEPTIAPDPTAKPTAPRVGGVASPPPTQVSGTAAAVLLGPELVWEPAGRLGEGLPVGFAELDGAVFVFAESASESVWWLGEGLVGWRSTDLVDWEPLGVLIDRPARVFDVAADAEGLIAVGLGAGGKPTVWRSDSDGAVWVAEALAVPDAAAGKVVIPREVEAVGGRVVVAGSTGADPRDRGAEMADAILSGTGLTEEELSSWSFSASPLTILVNGPFGIRLIEATPEDLGLAADALADLIAPSADQPIGVVWVAGTAGAWSTSTLADLGSNLDLVATEAGPMWISGYGAGRDRLWASNDGMDWQLQPTRQVNPKARLGDTLVGPESETDLAISDDGVTWRRLATTDLLPDGPVWGANQIAGGDHGVAMALGGWTGPNRSIEPSSALLIKDQYTLVAGPEPRQLVLSDATGEVLDISRGLIFGDPVLRVDIPTRTVAFLNPETGEPYVSFTLSELRRLETSAGLDKAFRNVDLWVLHSSDTTTWSASEVPNFDTLGSAAFSVHASRDAVLIASTPLPLTPTDRNAPALWVTAGRPTP